ncbi:PREDICTED: spatacsin-like [Amphimedon queenslandica]|uniref:Uncharacterized protein n=1 Tax=Amphimedon queenslandica TaxID=400682 RepID=A0AAN0JR49_AMPQE|nr:PREDICTED: spatacsin-like [Amphimedon queenslandica]|eukprot:XP_019859323.1 PREDICTED: spatacsin-like [Amphimedon queenslandica]
MTENGWLTSIEQDALEFLKMLETYYPTYVYETAKMIYNSSSDHSYHPPVTTLSPVNSTGNVLDMYPETFGGDHPLVWEPVSNPLSPASESQRGLYLETPLVSVLRWNNETRQRILFDAVVISGTNKDSVQSHRLVSPEDQFTYYLLHHDLDTAQSLLPSLSHQTSHSLISASSCNVYCRDTLLDQLVREGYTGNMNLQKILYHIGRLHNLFSTPHPLSNGSDLIEKFHVPFIQYLIQNQFVGLLYTYLDHYKLGLTSQSISELRLDIKEVPSWVQLLVQCRLTAINPTEPERVFSTSLACSKHLFNTSTVSDGIRSGHILTSLATLMYSPVIISEAIDPANSDKVWYINETLLKQSLAAYPTLQAAIFPSRQTKLTPSESQDVTLYELLKGTVPFDISRLFKWQKSNKFAAANEDIDASGDMPHFSHPALTQHSSHSIKLTYTYYLYQGQPSFAFANFVAAKLSSKSNINKRIDKAVRKVYQLAMADFNNSCLVSSCVSFTEMLSRDSTTLRIDTQAAIRIFNYRTSTETGTTVPGGKDAGTMDTGGVGGAEEAAPSVGEVDEINEAIKNKIVSQFIQLYQSSESSCSCLSVLLHHLIEATKYEVTSNSFKPYSVEAENVWLLVQRFCQYHSLPPSTAYLIECAKNKEWLSLLCHAQLHKIAPQEVISVVEKHFSDQVLKEHLQLALSTIEATPTSSSPALSDHSANGRSRSRRRKHAGGSFGKGKKKSSAGKYDAITPRDVRADFYNKVGLGAKKDDKPAEATPTASKAESVVTKTLSPVLMTSVILEGLPPALTQEDLPSDLFSVLFQCQDHTSPWRALLAYSIGLERPLLAILASYYEDSSLLDCMCVWLVATIGSKSLKKVAEPLNLPLSDSKELNFTAELQWRVWSKTDLGLVLLAGVLEETVPAGHFPLLFHYFDEVIN